MSGESEFGLIPLVIAAVKKSGKVVHNVAVNAQANARGQEAAVAAPDPIVVPGAPASSAIPFFLASTVGLGLGLAAGYMVGHARST